MTPVLVAPELRGRDAAAGLPGNLPSGEILPLARFGAPASRQELLPLLGRDS